MHKASFAAGLILGGTVAIGAAISVPGLIPNDKAPATRSERVVQPIVVEIPAPSHREAVKALPEEQAPAAEKKQPLEVDLKREAEALAVMMKAAKMRSNETTAIATLRNIISAQAQFQSTARADENNNGVGEYASFGELSGGVGVRDGEKLIPPVLSSAFRKVENGRVRRNGYYYRIFLARAGGDGVSEQRDGGFRAYEVDPRLTETTWCAYAWPVQRGVTGERCFFVNQAGDIFANTDRKYGGEEEPSADAAFEPGSPGILGKGPLEGVGSDRGAWKRAG